MAPIVVFFFMLVGAAICAAGAHGKGRDATGWALLGFLFPIIAIVAICVVDDLHARKNADDRLNRKLDEANTRIRSLQRQLGQPKPEERPSVMHKRYRPESEE